jgi:sterol 3beta-glucosyltransferase
MPALDSVLRLTDSFEWCDLVLGSHMAGHAVHLAEQVGRPWISFHTTPNLRSHAYAHPAGPLWWHLLRKPGLINLATHELWDYWMWASVKTWTNELRQQALHLTRLASPADSGFLKRLPRLVAASPAIFPAPADWPSWWHLTGYPAERESDLGSLPPEVEKFLAAGEPPVFFGFSSSPILNESFWTNVIGKAIERLGCRAIIGAGWSAVPASLESARVLLVQSVPFRQLFPRVLCVVHACGVGTLSEAVMSGTPSVAVPVFGEQKFIAARAYLRGLTPRPVELKALGAARLARMIRRAVMDQRYRSRTMSVAQRMIRERGVTRACEVVERHLSERPDRLAAVAHKALLVS